MDYKKTVKDLEELCAPIIEYINKHFDPHYTVRISADRISVTRETLGIPVKIIKD